MAETYFIWQQVVRMKLKLNRCLEA